MRGFLAGDWLIAVDAPLERLLRAKLDLQPFEREGAARVFLQRVDATPAGAFALNGTDATQGAAILSGDGLHVQIPEDPFAAEAALRAAFNWAVLQQGGLLLHAAGFAYSSRAVVATGPSGAGKSTLAAFGVQAGAGLLSDETIALLPGGTVAGTPFHSTVGHPSTVHSASLAGLLVLNKGPEERLTPVPPAEAARALMSQVYRPAPGTISSGEVLRRVSAWTSDFGIFELTFRKDPAVGTFLKHWLGA